MCICIHETIDKYNEHRIKGTGIEIIDLLTEKEAMMSSKSRRNKNIIFFITVIRK